MRSDAPNDIPPASRTGETPTVSVVICCYTDDRWSLLLEAIRSARAQVGVATEVIVVVDHNPALLDRVRAEVPDIRVMPNLRTKGLSGARNTGIEAARGPLVAFLDDDAVAAPDMTALLADCLKDPDVLGAGGRSDPRWEAPPPRWFPEEFLWTIGCSHRGLPRSRRPVRNLMGGVMAVRRSVFETVGGFRTDLGRVNAIPLGCEETELCIRAAQAMPRGRFIYEPSAFILHFVPARRVTWDYFSRRCLAEGYSKALVAGFVGSGDGLSTERSYVLKVLSTGVLKGLRDALTGDAGGLGRAAAIVAGLAITTFGFVRGRLTPALREKAAGGAEPVPPIPARAPSLERA